MSAVAKEKSEPTTTDFLREGMLKTSYEGVECDELGIELLSGVKISVGSLKDVLG